MIELNLLQMMQDTLGPPPGFWGVTVGIVTNNQDEEDLGRVKVELPWFSEDDESDWLRVVAPMAGKDRGCYFLPEVQDEVLIAFDHGDPQRAFVLGSLWNGQDKPPIGNADGQHRRMLKSRSGHLICLDDSPDAEKIVITAAGGKSHIVIDAQKDTITISADADLTIQAAQGKLTLSGNGIAITSEAEVKIEAKQNMDLEAGPQLNIKGQMVNIN